MTRLGIMLAAALMTSITGGTVHAKMVLQTFPVLAGAAPHDVYPAPDGAVWFTAQSAGKLGRLDPRTARADLIALGAGRGAAWRDCGARRRRLDQPKGGRTP